MKIGKTVDSRGRRVEVALRDKYRRFVRRLAGPRLLHAFGRCYPHAFFVEIGANDGEKHDHLLPVILSYPWEGVMVEPVPHIFARLQENYRSLARVSLERCAIANRDGHLPFYYLAEPGPTEHRRLPEWYDAIGSFSRENVLRHAEWVPDLSRRLVSTDVPCLTLESLCRKHAITRLDVLLIDTEGYDHEILRQVDLEVRRPRLLIYEHYHLSPDERNRCLARLALAGYGTMEEGYDTWCLDRTLDDSLSSGWERIRPRMPAMSAYSH